MKKKNPVIISRRMVFVSYLAAPPVANTFFPFVARIHYDGAYFWQQNIS